jgi:hypothetical protein
MTAETISPSPSVLPWPKAPDVPSWRERAAARLATLRAEGRAAPPYAGDPANIQRANFGQTAGDHEINRIYQTEGQDPATAPVPQYIWPRGTPWLGR